MDGPPPAVCVRLPDRATALSCTRCGRPACPACLREASVGHQCVDCINEAGRTVRPARTAARARLGGRPVVLPTLIAINVAAFVLTAVQARSISANYLAPLARSWALAPELVADGDWWRLVTAGFMHAGPLHIAFNMIALWVLGRDLERALGSARFLAVYVVALLGGSAAVMLFAPPDQPVVGASGAVFGLMGGLAVALRKLRMPAGQVIGLIGVNVVISVVVPGISLVDHLGGLAVGAAAMAAIVYAPARNPRAFQIGAIAGLAVLVLALSALGAALVA